MAEESVGSIIGFLRLDASQWMRELGMAEAKAKELSRTDPRVNVSTTAAEATAQLGKVSAEARKLDRANPSIDVDVDSGAALAEMAALEKATRKLEDADASLAVSRARLTEVQKRAKAGSSQLLAAENAVRKAIRAREDAVRDVNTETSRLTSRSDTAAGAVGRLNNAFGTMTSGAMRTGPLVLGAIVVALGMLGPAAAAALAGVTGLAGGFGVALLAYQGFKDEIAAGTELGQQLENELSGITDQLGMLGSVAAEAAGPGVVSALSQIEEYLGRVDGPVAGLARDLGEAFSISAGGLITGLQNLEPLMRDFGQYAKDGARWLADFADSQEFKDFINYARQHLPEIIQFLADFVEGVVAMGKALAPVGEALMGFFDLLFRAMSYADDVADFMSRLFGGGDDAKDASLSVDQYAKKVREATDASRTAADTKLAKSLHAQARAAQQAAEAAQHAADKQTALDVATSGAAAGIMMTTPAVDAFGNSLRDAEGHAVSAKTALDNLAASVQGLGSTTLDVSQTQIAYEAAIDNVTRALKQNGRTLNVNTDAGRANKTALDNVVRTSRAHIAAMIRDGRSTRDVTRATRAANKEIDEAAHKLSGNAQAADRLSRKYRISKGDVDNLRTSLDRVPGNTEAHVSTPGAKSAKDDVDQLNTSIGRLHGKTVTVGQTGATAAAGTVRYLGAQIDSLHDKHVTITVDTIKRFGGGTLRYLNQADGGVVDYYANGGVVQRFADGGENHVAQIAPAGSYRVWAEQETGGEAYIPLSPAKRARSEMILATVAERFGMQVQKYADGGLATKRVASGGPGSPTFYTTITAPSNDAQAIWREFNYEFRRQTLAGVYA